MRDDHISSEIFQPDQAWLDQLPNKANPIRLLKKGAKERAKLQDPGIRNTWSPYGIFLVLIPLILLGILLALPLIWPRWAGSLPSLGMEFSALHPKLLYENTDIRTPLVAELAIYERPDPTSHRLASLLFNEPCQLLGPASNPQFFKIRLSDGLTGFVEANKLSKDATHIEPHLAIRQVMVLSRSKNLMTDTNQGALIMSVPMGTILFVDYETVSVMRVRMPGGKSAWISTSGIVLLDDQGHFLHDEGLNLFVSSAMNFSQTPFEPGAMTGEGSDIAGVIYIAGKTNDVRLPRTLAQQAEAGEPVNLHSIGPGDCLFFHAPQDPNTIVDAAIVIEPGNVMMVKQNDSRINIWNIEDDPTFMANLATVRRYIHR